jgi:hypothetical protein
MTEDSTRSAGEHGCHPSSFPAEARVAHGKHAAMNTVQAAAAHSRGSALTAHAEFVELCKRDRSVLPGGDSRDLSVVGAFCIHGDA